MSFVDVADAGFAIWMRRWIEVKGSPAARAGPQPSSSYQLAMSLPPILVHFFRSPLPYSRTLALQERLHALQLSLRREGNRHPDLLLLLQHRPVYTAGRRQTSTELDPERTRLAGSGADFVSTQRGGQLTYHGPGQLVGYPLLDLGRPSPTLGIRDYICALQTALRTHLLERHGIESGASEHTGVFLDAATKVGSIGVQVRHRLTTHGFALNVTDEPRAWFDRIVACGLADVRAGSIQSALIRMGRPGASNVEEEARALVPLLGNKLGRDMVWADLAREGEVGEAIHELEEHVAQMEGWPETPRA
jgi:lipoate-protein ligase B